MAYEKPNNGRKIEVSPFSLTGRALLYTRKMFQLNQIWVFRHSESSPRSNLERCRIKSYMN